MKSVFIENRKARHNYTIIETLECGIELKGNEVKSIRKGSCQLTDAYIYISDNTLMMKNSYIPKWDTANIFDVDERRDRKLLAHKKEIQKLQEQIKLNGYTLIPLKMYFKNGKCKVELGVCKGKKLYDKRQCEKEKTIKREIERSIK